MQQGLLPPHQFSCLVIATLTIKKVMNDGVIDTDECNECHSSLSDEWVWVDDGCRSYCVQHHPMYLCSVGSLINL
jgi:hypothetical protein